MQPCRSSPARSPRIRQLPSPALRRELPSWVRRRQAPPPTPCSARPENTRQPDLPKIERSMQISPVRTADGSESGRQDGSFVTDARDRTGLHDTLSILGVWLLLIIATTLVRHDFLSTQTLLAVTFTMSISGILAVAQALVVISGGLLDLSLPVSLTLSAWATVTALNNDLPTWAAILIGILAGAAWGAVNGLIVVFGKLNPIIVTLAMGFGGLAVLLLVFLSAQIPSHSDLRRFGLGRFLGLPNVFWPMVIVIILAGLALSFTRWGRRLKAV